MSEYINIDVETTDDPHIVIFHTNLKLAPDGPENYPDSAAGDEGSPLAQAIFFIDGIEALTIESGDLIVTHSDTVELFHLADEIHAALTDFFL